MTNLQSFSLFFPALLIKRWCFFLVFFFFRIFGHDDTHPTLRLVISFIYFGFPLRCIFGLQIDLTDWNMTWTSMAFFYTSGMRLISGLIFCLVYFSLWICAFLLISFSVFSPLTCLRLFSAWVAGSVLEYKNIMPNSNFNSCLDNLGTNWFDLLNLRFPAQADDIHGHYKENNFV